MQRTTFFMAASALAGLALVVGCGVASEDDRSPDVAEGEVEEQQLVNFGGGWTANAAISQSGPTLVFTSSFTGPANSSRGMGECALQRYDRGDGVGRGCTGTPQALPDGGVESKQQAIDRECATAPSTLPSGGYRYCVAPNGTGTKECYFRPGPQNATYCAGSPATKTPMTTSASGTFGCGLQLQPPAGTTWITYACIDQCSATDGSSTSATQRVLYCVGNGHGGQTCY